MENNIALLFLIYDKINKKMCKFIKKFNIYIHAKYIDKMELEYKKYLINDIIETKWADISIVDATINLLKESYNNINNKFFILLSQDSYPLYNPNIFIEKLNNILDNSNLSIFYLIKQNKKIYKSSQFWILNRNDVKFILENKIL